MICVEAIVYCDCCAIYRQQLCSNTQLLRLDLVTLMPSINAFVFDRVINEREPTSSSVELENHVTPACSTVINCERRSLRHCRLNRVYILILSSCATISFVFQILMQTVKTSLDSSFRLDFLFFKKFSIFHN